MVGDAQPSAHQVAVTQSRRIQQRERAQGCCRCSSGTLLRVAAPDLLLAVALGALLGARAHAVQRRVLFHHPQLARVLVEALVALVVGGAATLADAEQQGQHLAVQGGSLSREELLERSVAHLGHLDERRAARLCAKGPQSRTSIASWLLHTRKTPRSPVCGCAIAQRRKHSGGEAYAEHAPNLACRRVHRNLDARAVVSEGGEVLLGAGSDASPAAVATVRRTRRRRAREEGRGVLGVGQRVVAPLVDRRLRDEQVHLARSHRDAGGEDVAVNQLRRDSRLGQAVQQGNTGPV
eukprot:5482040-Prymnesium_polylepis.1